MFSTLPSVPSLGLGVGEEERGLRDTQEGIWVKIEGLETLGVLDSKGFEGFEGGKGREAID